MQNALRLLIGATVGYVVATIRSPRMPDSPQQEEGKAEETDSTEIELGAEGSELRYWRAKEAQRQGEISLRSENALIAATITQATTMLGWVITASTAASIAAITSSNNKEWQAGAYALTVGLTVTAFLCIFVVFPRPVQSEGFDAPQIIDSVYRTELEQLESLAYGQFEAIESNRQKTRLLRGVLSAAWISFSFTPLLALLIYETYSYGLLARAKALLHAP